MALDDLLRAWCLRNSSCFVCTMCFAKPSDLDDFVFVTQEGKPQECMRVLRFIPMQFMRMISQEYISNYRSRLQMVEHCCMMLSRYSETCLKQTVKGMNKIIFDGRWLLYTGQFTKLNVNLRVNVKIA